MSLVPFIAVAFVTGGLSLLTRRQPAASAVLGVAGLVAGLLTAATIRPETALAVGGTSLAGGPYVRLFLLLACAAALLVAVVSASSTWPRSLLGATLVVLGAGAVALGVGDRTTAVLAATAGAIAGTLIAVPGGRDRPAVVAAGHLRALVAAAALVLPAIALAAAVGGGGPGREDADGVLGIAFLAASAGVALRLGAIPFHAWASRLAGAAPAVALPLLLAWSPAVFVLVTGGWAEGSGLSRDEALVPQRTLIVIAATATIVLGTAAAIVHDDIDRIVGYSIVADAGVALLALASPDPAAWPAARAWLLMFAMTKTAFAAWAAAMRAAYRTRRVAELGGWAHRAPSLLLALLAIGLAGVGAPGLEVFTARETLVRSSVDPAAQGLVMGATVAPAALYLRLLLVGIARPGPSVRARAASASPPRTRRRPSSAPTPLRRAIAARSASGATVSGIAVLALATLAVALAGGGLGVRDASVAAVADAADQAASSSAQR